MKICGNTNWKIDDCNVKEAIKYCPKTMMAAPIAQQARAEAVGQPAGEGREQDDHGRAADEEPAHLGGRKTHQILQIKRQQYADGRLRRGDEEKTQVRQGKEAVLEQGKAQDRGCGSSFGVDKERETRQRDDKKREHYGMAQSQMRQLIQSVNKANVGEQ